MPEHVERAKKLADKVSLPSDLPTLKKVLTERLEAAATGAQKNLKGALSQQAIDNWAACVDMDTALAEVSKQCVLGSIEIARAEDAIWHRSGGTWSKVTGPANQPADMNAIQHEGDDPPDATIGADGEHYRQLTGIPAAKAAFDTAVAAIEAVTAANTPVWRIGTTDYAANPPSPIQMSGTYVDVLAKHPDGKTIAGKVMANYTTDGTSLDLRRFTPSDQTLASASLVRLTPTGVSTGDVVRITGKALNLCGPSKIVIDLTIA